MRDPSRIPVVLAAVRVAWTKQPDLRLAQLLVNAIRPSEPCPDVFYVEDDALLECLARYEALAASVAVAITGWRFGFRKVSHTQVLQELAGMSLSEAKTATDSVLDGRTVELQVRGSAAAARLAAALSEHGAVVRVAEGSENGA